MGGWPLFGAPQPYRQLTDPLQGADRRPSSFVIVAADTIGDEVAIAKEGLVDGARRPAAVRDGLQGADA